MLKAYKSDRLTQLLLIQGIYNRLRLIPNLNCGALKHSLNRS